MRRMLLAMLIAATACNSPTAPAVPHHWELRYYWGTSHNALRPVDAYYYCTTHNHKARTPNEVTDAMIYINHAE